jgi:hypothetical protein
MRCRFAPLAAFAAAMTLAACAPGVREPPGGGYRKVSELAKVPDVFPGLGTVYVQPDTMPVGPYRAYDGDGRLVATVYMVPTRDVEERAALTGREGAPLPIDHVDMRYSAPHPGLDEPHYRVILWHVPPERADSLK